MYREKVRIGTVVDAHVRGGPAAYVRQILPHGFESFQLTFGNSLAGVRLPEMAAALNEVLADADARISALGVYGNPLGSGEGARELRRAWRRLIDNAHRFGCDLVCGFTGGLGDRPLDANIKPFARVFRSLQRRAADRGVRLAFENCAVGGNWQRPGKNLALDPAAWEMIFDAIPSENVGLEWEPCHQMIKLIEPIAQLRKWVHKVFHVHGKDATIAWDVLREYGIGGAKRFARHRTPGFGDSNWTEIVSVLRGGGFEGSIDIEGWHDPVYRGELEMMGQVRGLNYLRQCRGGAFVPDPSR